MLLSGNSIFKQGILALLCCGLFAGPALAKTKSLQHTTSKTSKPSPKSKSTKAQDLARAQKAAKARAAAQAASKAQAAAKARAAAQAAALHRSRELASRSAVRVNPMVPGGPLEAVRYRVAKVSGVGCHVVDIDLNNPGVRLVCARAQDLGETRASFSTLVQHHKPLAAITGTFFDPRSGTVICNLVQNGKLLTDGHHGNTVMVDGNNRGHFLDTANRAGHELDWSKSEFAVSCGPTLLHGGRVVLDPSSEGFHDTGLFRSASRCGLALLPNNHLMLVTVNKGVTLGKFALMLKGLGASDAINLDGGSSTGMYVRGHYPSRPARSMTNLIMVTVRPGDPMPKEVLLEATGEATAPSNVEDFSGPPPSPDQVKVELESAVDEVQPIRPENSQQP